MESTIESKVGAGGKDGGKSGVPVWTALKRTCVGLYYFFCRKDFLFSELFYCGIRRSIFKLGPEAKSLAEGCYSEVKI